MNTLLNHIRKIWLSVFLIAAIGFGIALLLNQSSSLATLQIVSYKALLSVIFCHTLFWIIYCRLWQALILQASSVPISFTQSLVQTVLLVIGKYFPGKIWGMVARLSHLKKCGVARNGALSATFHEQYLVLHSAFVFCGILASFLLNGWWKPAMFAATLILIISGEKMQHQGLNLFERFSHRHNHAATGYRFAPIPALQYHRLLTGYLLSWLFSGATFAGIYFAFFDSTYRIDLIALLLLANALGITIGFFALFAPGGIGIREAVSSGVLVQVMPLSETIVLAALFRLWLLVTDLFFGAMLLGLMRHHLNPDRHSNLK